MTFSFSHFRELEDLNSSSGSGDLTNEIMAATIDFYITDEGGRAFWKQHFLDQAEVAFELFAEKLGSWKGQQGEDELTKEDKQLLIGFYGQLLGGTLDQDLQIVPPSTVG